MALTDLAVRTAKPTAKPHKLSDANGLYLLINPTGSKLWKLKYRIGGLEKKLSLGAYPQVSLAEARAKRDSARQQIAAGIDPGDVKKRERQGKLDAGATTFNVIADELLEKKIREKKAGTTLTKARWLLEHARPKLGKLPITAISARDVLDVLQEVEGVGNLETARRLRATIGQVFRLAIATARAENDPTFALRGALTSPKVTHRAAITDPDKFGGLLRAIDDYEGARTTKIACLLQILTATRPGEIRAAEWSEFDLAKAQWAIPANRMKMRREHLIPLSAQAVQLITDLRPLTGEGKFLFPSERTVTRPISENTLNGALRRLGFTKEEVTSHGFRSTFSTIANESGLWKGEAIERALAHVDTNAIRKAYNRAAYWDDRVKLMQWWADQCDEMRNGKPTSRRA